MRILLLCVVLTLCACPTGGGDGGTGGGGGGGSGGGGGDLQQWDVVQLDPNASGREYIAAAFDPVQQRVGVVYYTPRGTETNPGHPDFDIKYVEWRQGTITGPETIRFVQDKIGLTIAFNPTTGEPTVSYLGGAAGFIVGQSIYWFQSDAVVTTRNNGTWTESVIATDGSEVTCGNPVSDRAGILVGVWPALAFDSTGKAYLTWRDGHDAQFPQQDWNGSDVELAEGALGSLTPTTCLKGGGDDKKAWGGRQEMIIGPNDQPALVYDQTYNGADTSGQNVIFQKRNANGTWAAPQEVMAVARVGSGPSLAYDATEGYGIAAVEADASLLQYIKSADGVNWTSPDDVFGAGSGGWYPSLAMDPVNHEPAIAFYVCSPTAGVNELSCPENSDELRVTQRIANNWRETTVDKAGGYLPKLGFFNAMSLSGAPKRVVAYRDPRTGVVKLAVER